MGLIPFILQRPAVSVLLGVTVLVFPISHAIPGDPARMMAGQKAGREAAENIRRSLGLDRPLPQRYVRYLGDLLQGDLGTSIRNHRPVTEDLKDFFSATLEPTLAGMALCIGVGPPLGIWATVRRNRVADHGIRVFSVVGVSTPVFWLGLVAPALF
ncbi:MAG: ABC transporter permease [Desulfococcaceae bacterium]